MTITQIKRARSAFQPTGQWIRTHKRLAIYLRDEFTCLVCGADLHGAAPSHIHLDHAKPKSKGGSNESTNLYTCCAKCNCSRQDKPLNKFVDADVLKGIRLHMRRSLTKYVALAKELISTR